MGVWFKTRQRKDFDRLLPSLRHWFESGQGQELGKQQQRLLDQRMTYVFGYHCALIGIGSVSKLLSASRIGHRVTMSPESHPANTNTPPAPEQTGESLLRCLYAQWPIADRTLDAVVLHHPLEFCLEPQQLLREASRTMTSGGKLIIIGFNPYSVLSILSVLNRCFPARRQPLSEGRCISANRIQDWLKLLGYAVDEVSYESFIPSRFPVFLQWFGHKIQAVARRLNLPAGRFYIITATLDDLAVSPLTPGWKVPGKGLAGSSVVEQPVRRD